MTEVLQRTRVRVADLPFGIPNVPAFDGEASLDAAKEGTNFLKAFTQTVQQLDWQKFGTFFDEGSWWRDSLTLTFDKRTLKGKQDIVEAFKTLSEMRKPSGFSAAKDHTMGMEPQFLRLAPQLATLDVPFAFTTEAPKTKCVGLLKLIPKDGGWKIWVLSTAVVSLEEHPFQSLPRSTPSLIDASQRGNPQAQGFPRFQGILDAVVIGTSISGLANAIMLDSVGANVAAFDAEPVAGSNWSTKRYENVTLHHNAFMIGLPMFPVPKEGYPNYLKGTDITRYFSAAIKELKLPVFAGIKVVSNTFDDKTKLWTVGLQDVSTGKETSIQAKNIVISTGFIVSPETPKIPNLENRHLFKGPIEHTAEHRSSDVYKDKDVLIIGSGNSAHDVANNLALGIAKSVTILQRSPTVLLDFEVFGPMVEMRYRGQFTIEVADFLDFGMPIAVLRDMAKGALAGMIESQAERCKQFESKGYMVDRAPCLMSRAYEERGRAFYVDQPKTFDLVFADKIKIQRGEAKGFVENGVVVRDAESGKDRIIEASGVILATGYDFVDLPKKWKESGFLDEKSASMVVNVNLLGVDAEGENPGYVTASGHPHLYFSGLGFYTCRWMSRYTAIQVMADVRGIFPATYPRSK